jgi:hypothetical protein
VTASEATLVAPRLSFQLPGRWLALDPREEGGANQRIDAFAREVVGTADDAVLARRRLAASLRTAADRARDAAAHAMFVCLEAAPGVATPASLTVHAPEGMRMSPAIGTSTDAVLRTLEESLRVLDVPGIDTARRLEGSRASALRLHRLVAETIEEDGVTATSTRLEADYWYAVPGSKQVVLASFATPLGEIPHAMLNLFDSIALAASFRPESPEG